MTRQAERRTRQDYTPQVRPRELRQDGRTRLSPSTPEVLSTKFQVTILPTTNGRADIVAAVTKQRIRIIRVKIVQPSSDGQHFFELYFGTGTNIQTDVSKAIDILDVRDLSSGSTRTYSRGDGPIGAVGEPLSTQAIVAPTTTQYCFVEYPLER